MYTKSIIQQAVENINAKSNFKAAIDNLMDKYTIEDSVFVFKNGFLNEAVSGYFNVEKEYDNLDEAVSELNINNMGIRVIKDKFQTGKLFRTISECNSEKQIFDLDRLEQVR